MVNSNILKMKKVVVLFIIVCLPILSKGQQISIGDSELNVFHGTHGSLYANSYYDVGYSIGLYTKLNESVSVFSELKPSVATDAYSFVANVPLMVGLNYGKIGFDPMLPSNSRFGAYASIGMAPYFLVGSGDGGTNYQFCADAGIRFRLRARDMTVSFLSYANFGQGLRITYSLPPFE